MSTKKNWQTPPKVEVIEALPIAVIATDDGFLSSYLAQKLLELPLKIVFVSPKLEEVEHLVGNDRFTQMEASSQSLNAPALPQANYIFQLVSSWKGQPSIALTQQFLIASKLNQAKFLLIRQTDSRGVERERLEESEGIKGDASETIERERDRLISELTKTHNLNAHTVRVLDAYGPKMPRKNGRELVKLLEETRQNKLVVKGEGLSPLYPIYASDVASALAKAMFTESAREQKLLIAGDEITTVNLVYKVREILFRETGVLLETTFSGEESPASIADRAALKSKLSATREILKWKPEVRLEAGLEKTLKWMRRKKGRPVTKSENKKISKLQQVNHSVSRAAQEPQAKEKILPYKEHKKKQQKSNKLGRLHWKKAAVALGILLLIPPLSLVTTVSAGTLMLKQAGEQLLTGSLDSALAKSQRSERLFSSARNQLGFLATVVPGKTLGGQARSVEKYMEAGQLLAQLIQHATKVAGKGAQIKDILLVGSQANLTETANSLSGELSVLNRKFAQFELILSENNEQNRALIEKVLSWEGNGREGIKDIRRSLETAKKIAEITPSILGAAGKNTYLVLLQNNAELRPTGGFIGSYAVVTFENARLLSLDVEDVYVADGQLKGHVEPPPEIKEYLGEAGWYLRDSNWDPDFPTAARQIEWFFEKETGIQVDGTIGANLYVLQEILKALGPVEIPDYNQTINAENLFTTAEAFSEINSFPGSTQKKDFLASLTKNIFFRLEQASPSALIGLTKALVGSLDKGQLLLAVHDHKLQSTLNDRRWDGSLKETACRPEWATPCLKTFLALREANVGVNKANFFVKREIRVEQALSDNQTKLSVLFRNQSQTGAWPGGDYKNFLRVYTNPENRVTQVTIDGKRLEGSEVTIRSEHGKRVVGFLVTVPEQKERIVTLSFQNEQKMTGGGERQTSLLIQKQPGTEGDPLEVIMTFPGSTTVSRSNIPLQVGEGKRSLSQNFLQDLELQVEFENAQ